MVLHVKERLGCLKKENRGIPKTKACSRNKTSPTGNLVDIEDIILEGLRFENSETPRTHSEGVHCGQNVNLDPGQSIVSNMKRERKMKSYEKMITVHSSSDQDTLPTVE